MNTPAEAATSTLASKLTTGGGGIAFVAGMSSHDVIAWAGLSVAVAGFLSNIWFKWDARRRSTKEHEARMARILKGRRTDTDVAPLAEDD